MANPSPESVKRVAFAFVAAICEHDVDVLASLMTEDHVFVDSLGNRVEGKRQMKAGWESYFRMVPDCAIAIDETLVDAAVVVLLGTARGTYSRDGELRSGDEWATPAAWRVLIRGSLVAEWRVYADNEPIRQVMARSRAQR